MLALLAFLLLVVAEIWWPDKADWSWREVLEVSALAVGWWGIGWSCGHNRGRKRKAVWR